MALYPRATQAPARYKNGDPRPGVPYTGGPRKVVHHKTVTSACGWQSAGWNLYGNTGSWPHFTVCDHGVLQHFDTRVGSRSLRNKTGGVQTNSDSAYQIEVVGFPTVTMPEPTAWHLVALLKWIGELLEVPWAWPAGRPPQTSEDGYGENNGHRFPLVWDNTGGHFGHSQVPENTHWDPAYTDTEWWWLNAAMNP